MDALSSKPLFLAEHLFEACSVLRARFSLLAVNVAGAMRILTSSLRL
jgi:hypothetical protein